jgi:hypothetical protein
MARKKAQPKRRNMVVVSMMLRSAKAGSHGDKKKRESKRACRGKVRW